MALYGLGRAHSYAISLGLVGRNALSDLHDYRRLAAAALLPMKDTAVFSFCFLPFITSFHMLSADDVIDGIFAKLF